MRINWSSCMKRINRSNVHLWYGSILLLKSRQAIHQQYQSKQHAFIYLHFFTHILLLNCSCHVVMLSYCKFFIHCNLVNSNLQYDIFITKFKMLVLFILSIPIKLIIYFSDLHVLFIGFFFVYLKHNMNYFIVNIVHNIYIYVVKIWNHPEIRRYLIHKVNSPCVPILNDCFVKTSL